MAAVDIAELAPSLSAFLAIDRLRGCAGCLCSTPAVPGVVHGTNRNGPFLILEVDRVGRTCLCVPLYGNGGPNRLQLDQRLKTGPGRGWREGLSHFSVFEFWIIPFSCYVDASHIEISRPGNRQRYAQARPNVLAEMVAHKHDSGSPFAPVRHEG